jgi:hypothetical protein
MQKVVDTYLLKFVKISLVIFLPVAAVLALAALPKLMPFVWGYLLSFVFTGSNFLVMRKIDLNDHSRFVKILGVSLALRFIAVIGAIIFVLKTKNDHQIFFTISFIISYICHSVTEIIFLNKILETDTKK